MVKVLLNLAKNPEDFFCSSWDNAQALEAYEPMVPFTDVTTQMDLTASETLPPIVTVKPGRPKKKRYESQQATLDLEKTKKSKPEVGDINTNQIQSL
jgi:hypothetical protein